MSVAKSAAMSQAAGSPARRILYVVNSLAVGGCERTLLYQTAALDRTRYAPAVASLELIAGGELALRFEEAGIPVHRLRRPYEPRVAAWPRLLTLLDRLRPEIVHTHLVASGVAGRVASRMAARGWTRPPAMVATVHSLSDWEENRWHPLRWLDRRTLGMAAAIITVSNAVRAALVRVSPGLASSTCTIYNGVALADFLGAGAERSAARAALGYGPGDFVVGTVARLEREKGLDTLVEAAAMAARKCPRLRLLIVGDGPERRHLEALVRAHHLEDRTRLAGYQARVRSYLAAMDVFAAPSRSEALGVAIIEALAAGLPVVAARIGGIPEVVEDGVCGRLLETDAPACWAEILLDLATHPDYLGVLAAAAPARSRRFSLEQNVAALERVYDRALGLSPAAAERAAA